ncbi:hypothetical protein [Variovorax sp. M-6]|uniref:hypothetical protein n=1 Tax=Variovorax sp. M-6 TaxID=3233041 RepID=UPI003F9A4ED7
MATAPPLAKYKAKRNFVVTPEPAEGGEAVSAGLQFVIRGCRTFRANRCALFVGAACIRVSV